MLIFAITELTCKLVIKLVGPGFAKYIILTSLIRFGTVECETQKKAIHEL